ncbi:MAG: hypothetical protein ACM3XM_20635 [Mycobacterium leprae]
MEWNELTQSKGHPARLYEQARKMTHLGILTSVSPQGCSIDLFTPPPDYWTGTVHAEVLGPDGVIQFRTEGSVDDCEPRRIILQAPGESENSLQHLPRVPDGLALRIPQTR